MSIVDRFFWFCAYASVVLVCGVVMLLFTVIIPLHMTTQEHCLKAGFPAHQLTWNLQRYCVKRVDQTDVVVPFDKRWQQLP